MMAPITSRERRLLKKALSRSRECATLEELSGLAAGLLPSASLVRIKGHLATCPRCKTELALLEKFEAAEPAPQEEATVRWISTRLERQLFPGEGAPAPARGDPWWRRFIRSPALNRAGFALGAAMLLVAAVTGLWSRRPPGLASPSGTEAIFRSGALTGTSPVGDLDAAPSELRWDPLPAAASYEVRVTEVDRVELWNAETREPRVALPPAVRARLVPGKPLLWEVTAKDAAGNALASSGPQRVRVQPKY